MSIQLGDKPFFFLLEDGQCHYVYNYTAFVNYTIFSAMEEINNNVVNNGKACVYCNKERYITFKVKVKKILIFEDFLKEIEKMYES